MKRWIALIAGIALASTAALVAAQASKPVSVWSGVYAAAQNKRGEELHADVCIMCHGRKLNGAGQAEMPPSPAIAGESFLRKWGGRNVLSLFVYVRHTMPIDGPGTLADQQAADAIAHMFAVSGIPAGNRELPVDARTLTNIMIDEK